MSANRSDADLVAAYLGGDRDALGDIYARHADALYDTVTAMLRDRDEAADAVHDVFVAAAEQLGALREPERLRPWLFAIARRQVYLRVRRRARAQPTDFSARGTPDMSAPSDPHAEGARTMALELAAEVRAAAAGLDPRDQLLLELTARQGLGGRDLADALGVSEQQCHVLVHRMRERVARSLGALTVARMGRRDCADLAHLLQSWDGQFTVLVRKRVARHVDGCAVCAQTRSRYAVAGLLALLPTLAAPTGLFERVQASVGAAPLGSGTGGTTSMRFDGGSGFPARERSGLGTSPALAVTALLATAVTVVATVVIWLAAGAARGPDSASPSPWPSSTVSSGGSPSAASSGSPVGGSVTSSAGAGSRAPTDPASSVGGPALPASPTGPPPPVVAGFVRVSARTVDLGETQESAPLTLKNTGGRPVSWRIAGSTAPLSISAPSGALAPGASITLQVGLDRSGVAEGRVSRTFSVRSGAGGGASVTVTARVERAPDVRVVRAPLTLRCPWSTSPTVAAVVTDESAVASVRLSWEGPGRAGGRPMTSSGPDQWRGALGIGRVAGVWTWTVSATDARGNVGLATGRTVARC